MRRTSLRTYFFFGIWSQNYTIFSDFHPLTAKIVQKKGDLFTFSACSAQQEEIFCYFCIQNSIFLDKEPQFSLHLQIDQQNNRSATNEGCLLTPYRGVGIGGIRQCRAKGWSPVGELLFIKSASRLFSRRFLI